MFSKKENVANPPPQKTHEYTLVSAKYFLAMIPAEHKQHQILVNINQTLSLLQEDKTTSNSSAFWKSKPHTPLLDDMSRLAHLVNLKMYIIQAQEVETLQSDEKVKKGLNQLFVQVEDRINKLDVQLKRATVTPQHK